MSAFGYGTKTMAQSKNVLSETRTAYDSNKTEDDETAEAYGKFTRSKEQIVG